MATKKTSFREESVIFRNKETGWEVRTPAAPAPCIYVRIVDEDDFERVYWDFNEWCESKEQAQEVMGAIMGAIKEVAENRWVLSPPKEGA